MIAPRIHELAYRLQELKRWRDYLGIPINVSPSNFPSQAPLSAQTIIAAADEVLIADVSPA